MAENEDIPYNVSDHATAETETTPDEDQVNKSVLVDTVKYIDDQIARNNSFDVITPEGEDIMTTQQQVAVYKEVVAHLRNIKSKIEDKIKELR